MISRELLVIDPSTRRPETQGMEVIGAIWGGPWRVLRPALEGHRLGEDDHRAAGVVVAGSAASVHDDAPWLDDLAAWMRPIIDGGRRLPLLGICFGHQLIAHLAGAEVRFLHRDRHKEVGIRHSTVADSRILPAGDLTVISSHGEVVTAPPTGYRVVARRTGVPVDALEHGSLPILGVQFHPEGRDEFARHLGLDPTLVDTRVRRDGTRVLESFLRLAR